MQHEWRQIPGFVHYEASTSGHIRRARKTRGKTGRTLKPWMSATDGYWQVGLCVAGKASRHFVHRLVAVTFLGEPRDRNVDHKNGCRTDNQLTNLRYATQAQNLAAASGKRIIATSSFRGVSWNSKREKWCAFGSVNSKTKFLGCHNAEIDAAESYNKWAREKYGEFADLNQTDKFGEVA